MESAFGFSPGFQPLRTWKSPQTLLDPSVMGLTLGMSGSVALGAHPRSPSPLRTKSCFLWLSHRASRATNGSGNTFCFGPTMRQWFSSSSLGPLRSPRLCGFCVSCFHQRPVSILPLPRNTFPAFITTLLTPFLAFVGRSSDG